MDTLRLNMKSKQFETNLFFRSRGQISWSHCYY